MHLDFRSLRASQFSMHELFPFNLVEHGVRSQIKIPIPEMPRPPSPKEFPSPELPNTNSPVPTSPEIPSPTLPGRYSCSAIAIPKSPKICKLMYCCHTCRYSRWNLTVFVLARSYCQNCNVACGTKQQHYCSTKLHICQWPI